MVKLFKKIKFGIKNDNKKNMSKNWKNKFEY